MFTYNELTICYITKINTKVKLLKQQWTNMLLQGT